MQNLKNFLEQLSTQRESDSYVILFLYIFLYPHGRIVLQNILKMKSVACLNNNLHSFQMKNNF